MKPSENQKETQAEKDCLFSRFARWVLPAHTPESIPERISDLCSEIVHLERENEEISERLQQETEEARKLASHWRDKTSSKTKNPLPWENL